MRRRDFIKVVGSAVAWPMAARAQQARKRPIIGFLGASSSSVASQWIAAFSKRLSELGWIEGRTVAIDYRWRRAGINVSRKLQLSSSSLMLSSLSRGDRHQSSRQNTLQ